MAMDLSKGYSVTHLSCSHPEAMDLAKKPEWYHRRPASCGTEISSPYRTRSRSTSSFTSLSTSMHPEAGVCRDMEQGSEALGNYVNSTLAQGIGLYHEGVHGNPWHQGFYGPDQTGSPVPESSGGEESDSGSDVIFLVSSSKEPIICSSFIEDGMRHLVEPLSPAASSLDEGCYHLPQPLSSPSPDSSYSEESSDSSVDIPIHNTRPIVLLSDLRAVYGNIAESPVDISSDDSDVIEVSVTSEKKKSCVFSCKKSAPSKKGQTGKTHPECEGDKSLPGEVRRSSRVGKPVPEMSQFTCSVTRQSLRRQVKNDTVGLYNESYNSDDMEFIVRSSSSDAESVSQPNLSGRVSSHSDDSDMDTQTDRKGPAKSPQSKSHDLQRCVKASYMKRIKHKRKKPLTIRKTKRLRTKQKPNHRLLKEQHPKLSASRNTAGNKKAVTRRRRKRCSQTGPSALFSPREPEIKLKYAKIKEEKKDKKPDNFCPFVHIERRVCTVVNYQEEEVTVRNNRGHHHQTAIRSLSGFVPKTSCFQLGRLRTESKGQTTQLCCLCGQTANVMGLGDLHGPYFAAGLSVDCQNQQLDCRMPSGDDGKNEDKKSHELSNSHVVNSSDEGGDNESATVKSLLQSDNHHHPKVPLHFTESWIHEDCGIWSAGVFLVRGKLYGLAEAARLARETTCSTCQQTGAIMGCFQKGCPRNYHYRCAIQSGCVLHEDNFSMRCPDHKNKLFKSVTRQHKR